MPASKHLVSHLQFPALARGKEKSSTEGRWCLWLVDGKGIVTFEPAKV